METVQLGTQRVLHTFAGGLFHVSERNDPLAFSTSEASGLSKLSHFFPDSQAQFFPLEVNHY